MSCKLRAGVPLRDAILLLLTIIPTPVLAATDLSQGQGAEAPQFSNLAVEATEWAISFQITPPNSSWGIPYADERAWGTDPYYYQNATITGGRSDVPADQIQTLAYLIGGHDAGGGAAACLESYAATGKKRWMDVFQIYRHHFDISQLPSRFVSTPAIRTSNSTEGQVVLDESGYWAEQAATSAGADHKLGTADDVVELKAAFPSPEHGNPIAYSLLLYYKLTRDPSALTSLNRYGSWLVRMQIRSGNYSGAFPVTQERFLVDHWKPRMYETSQSAWILVELYDVTGNRTYLEAAMRAGDYMLTRQYSLRDWKDPRIDGALPYEWNRTEYNPRVSSNHAGYTLLAWSRLYQITSNAAYLYGPGGNPDKVTGGAVKFGNWLLSWQVTPSTYGWGDHRYGSDQGAVGGFYYGYDPRNHTFGSRVAESLWSASHGIKGLLALYHSTGNERYHEAADLAASWLAQMRYDDEETVQLQAIGRLKIVASSWWGRYSQFYQPDTKELEDKGITKFLESGSSDPDSIRQKKVTPLETALGVEWNIVDLRMVSRGERYQKMVWSWWPSVGFEPRYGSDVADGLFTISDYYNASQATVLYERMRSELSSEMLLPTDLQDLLAESSRLRESAITEFKRGWYLPSAVKFRNAIGLLEQARSMHASYEADKAMYRQSSVIVFFLAILVVALILYRYDLRKVLSSPSSGGRS